MLGGGMRQVGVIAVAGLISLEKMTTRLSTDHKHAKQLAEGLRTIPGIVVDEGSPKTNMIYFNLAKDVKITSHQIGERMLEAGILVDAYHPFRFRLVTHYQIDDDAVEKSITAFKKILQ
jgi:threonine aldolase